MICNANATLAQVQQVKLERPKHAKSFWQGIEHKVLIDAVEDECRTRGWKIEGCQFSLSPDKHDLAGAFRLNVGDVKLPEGQGLELGFLTSNAMRRRLKLVVGTRVFVCNNGMVSGDLVLCNKHTSGFDLFGALEGAMDLYHERALELPKKIRALQQRELAPVEVEHLLVETGRQEIMPWSRIGQVDEEYRNPTFGDHAVKTSWGLLNAFTHIVKKCPPLGQMDQINSFRELLPVHGKN